MKIWGSAVLVTTIVKLSESFAFGKEDHSVGVSWALFKELAARRSAYNSLQRPQPWPNGGPEQLHMPLRGPTKYVTRQVREGVLSFAPKFANNGSLSIYLVINLAPEEADVAEMLWNQMLITSARQSRRVSRPVIVQTIRRHDALTRRYAAPHQDICVRPRPNVFPRM